jgi:hypothetical protein
MGSVGGTIKSTLAGCALCEAFTKQLRSVPQSVASAGSFGSETVAAAPAAVAVGPACLVGTAVLEAGTVDAGDAEGLAGTVGAGDAEGLAGLEDVGAAEGLACATGAVPTVPEAG